MFKQADSKVKTRYSTTWPWC